MLVSNALRMSLLCLMLPAFGCAVSTYDGKSYELVYAQEPEEIWTYLHKRYKGACSYIGSESDYLDCLQDHAEPLDVEPELIAKSQHNRYHRSLGESVETDQSRFHIAQPDAVELLDNRSEWGNRSFQADLPAEQPPVLYSSLDE